MEFAALMVGPVEDAPRCEIGALSRPEIVTGAVVIRLEAGASAKQIASRPQHIWSNSLIIFDRRTVLAGHLLASTQIAGPPSPRDLSRKDSLSVDDKCSCELRAAELLDNVENASLVSHLPDSAAEV